MSHRLRYLRAVYRCRMCGELDTTERVEAGNANGFLSGAIEFRGGGPFNAFEMHKKHQCADGRFGILELVGLEPEGATTSPPRS